MTNKYIWLPLLAVSLSAIAFGQHGFGSHLDVRATDPTGAVVPNARIEITASAGKLAAVGHTNSKGIVTFDLPAGSYGLMVISRGFYFKTQRFALVDNEAQSISAILKLGACPGPGHPACIDVQPLAESDSPTDAVRLVVISVTDLLGEPISDAIIEASGTRTEIKAKANTDESGLAELRLPPGPYTVTATARSFRPWKDEVVIGKTPHQNIRIEIDIDCDRVICGSK